MAWVVRFLKEDGMKLEDLFVALDTLRQRVQCLEIRYAKTVEVLELLVKQMENNGFLHQESTINGENIDNSQ